MSVVVQEKCDFFARSFSLGSGGHTACTVAVDDDVRNCR